MSELGARLLVRRDGHGWRWCYRSAGADGDAQELWSSVVFVDRQTAEDAARTAYPDVNLVPAQSVAPPPWRRPLPLVAVGLAALAALRYQRRR